MMTLIKHLSLVAMLASCPGAIAGAQVAPPPDQPVGIMADACPKPLQRPAEVEALQKQGPKALFESKSPVVMAFLKEETRQRMMDRAGLCRYRVQDQAFAQGVGHRPAVVFIGDSITDFWPGLDQSFFSEHHFEGRGIGAQVTSQGVMRFEQDVVELHPRIVHILYGTNDIAGLGGATTFKRIQNNLVAMVQLARVNGIAVVLGTILPISHLPGGMNDPSLDPNIRRMNDWIRSYGRQEHVAVADYYPALTDGSVGFRADLNSDGVHPTLAGYRVMEPITLAAIQVALNQAPPQHGR